MRITAFGATDPGRRRSNNEDDLAIVDLTTEKNVAELEVRELPVGKAGVFLAVCDGVGGRRAGEIASSLALSELVQEIEALDDGCPRGEVFRKAVERVNRTVWQKAKDDPSLEGMATTLTAAVVCRGRAVLAHVGDSRAYVLREGQIRQVTRDQSFVESLVVAGALTEEEAAHSPYRNVILQAIGRKKAVEVALDAVDLREGDVLLLCTDGLSEKLAPADITRELAREDIPAAIRRMIELANERGGEDNITALAARLSDV
ncbi:MAG: PP2C family serine/threonine-protein phosphatase [Acidobacteriota bacterium]